MTVLVHNCGSDGDHEMEKSAMAAEPRVAEEELAVGRVPEQEQEPAPVPINLERILSANTMEEWLRLLRESVGPEHSQLHCDIIRFCKAYELTAHQMQLRRDALACVERAVREIWPRAEVHLFGSMATGLALPWSDIDVAIMPPSPRRDPSFRTPTTPIEWQNALSRRLLYRRGLCRSLKKVPNARVPVLKILFNSGIACDISFDVRNSHAGVAVIRQFMRQYEAFRPLCLVLKFFLGQNNLNELHTGGLGSFCIITMVISHLQKMRSIVEAGRGDLGALLLSFFAHYSNMHNYCTDVVSTRASSRGSSSKLEKGWVNSKKPELLAVEDPLDPTSDIGKGSHRIEQVRMKFSEAQRTLLTHWYNKHVLAQILDMSANSIQRPAPSLSSEKPKNRKSKRGGKRKNRSASGQDDCILINQPDLKIRRKLDHPQQGSGLVTKNQLECILSKHGSPNSISDLRPAIKRFRSGGFDEENFQSAQQSRAAKTPSQDGRDFLRRPQSNVALEANSSPTVKPWRSSSSHQASAKEDCHSVQTIHSQRSQEGLGISGVGVNSATYDELSRGRQDGSKGSHSLEASNLMPGNKSRKSWKDPSAKEDCRPIQSAAPSHVRHEGTNAGRRQQNQDEEINFEFWESQLTTRSKPRKTSLKQRENPSQFRDSSRSQDGSTADYLETPIVNSRKSPKHKSSEENCCNPIQPAANSHPLQGVDAEGIRGSRDERLLVDFWESQLATRPILRRETSPKRIRGNDLPARLVQSPLHPGRPQKFSKVQPTSSQDDKSPQLRGTAHHNNKHAQVVETIDLGRSLKGSKMQRMAQDENSGEVYGKRLQNAGGEMQPKPQDGQSVKDRGTEGNNNGNAQVVPIIRQHQSPQKGSKVNPPSLDERSLDHRGIGGKQDRAQAVQTIHPEDPLKGRNIQRKFQDEKSVEHSAASGGSSEHALRVQTTHPERPQTSSTIKPKSPDEKSVVDLDFWEAQLTTKRKSRIGSLIHQSSSSRGGVGRDPQPAVVIHTGPPAPQGKDGGGVGEVQGKKTFIDLPEPQFTKTRKSRSGSLLRKGIEEAKMDPSEHTIHHEQPSQGTNLDEGILRDFWEAQLSPKLKSQRVFVEDAPRPRKSAKSASWQDVNGKRGVNEVQPVKVHDSQQVHNNEKGFTGRSGDERKFTEFWEAQLAPRLKASKCSSKPSGCREGGGHSVEQSRPAQPQHDTDVKHKRSGDEKILLEFWEAQLAPRLKGSKCPSNLLGAGCGEEDEQQPAQKSQLGMISQDESKLVDFWEKHLTPKPKSRKGPSVYDQQQAAGGAVREEDAEKGNGHDGYDRLLSDFWESHLTPDVKSRKEPLKRDVIACEDDDEDVQPVERTHQRGVVPTQQCSGFAGRSGDEAILSTFWETCLNPAVSRKGYLRSNNSTEVI